jgi:opacity protein-like surface antigen
MRIHPRQLTGAVFVAAVALLLATPARAQLGVGARLAWVKADTDSEVEVDSVRFTGGQIRLGMSPRIGVEVSMDFHTEEFELLNEKVRERPIQASLLLKLATGNVQPFLLGGPGWYKRSVEPLDGPNDDLEVSSTEFGWHAGGGLEVLFGRHFGLHGDYRYTFLDFGDDDDIGGGLIPGLGGVLPGHRGSMWTLGATVYF